MGQTTLFIMMLLTIGSGLNHSEIVALRVARVGQSIRLLERERRNKRHDSGVFIRLEKQRYAHKTVQKRFQR